tara:strand:- start:2082 stop:2315 length:234 start_codon:yes stop_codon:yes gene_type:complete
MGLRTWFKRTFLNVEEVPTRARDEDGRFVADDPTTVEDEAWTTKDVSATNDKASVEKEEKAIKPAAAAPKKDVTLER